ncbi:MAG: polysaccharide pyruvyl transferase CsaB [Oscillospiraceae bacterium]|jgi:polysaccharide pyruvyl transferase CsaB
MKVITLISGGDVGGAKTHVLSLLHSLQGEVDVKLVCFTEGEFSREAEALGIDTLVIRKGFLTALRRLKKMIAAGNYDIIHCHGSRGNLMGMLLQRCLGLPVVTTIHSDNRLDYMGRPLANLVYGTINKIAIRRIRWHIGVSDQMTELLIRRGLRPGSMFTIYNGLDFSGDLPVLDRAQYLASVGADFPPDSIIVGIAARLDPVKSVSTLIYAFAAAAELEPRLRLLIAGEGPQRKELTHLVASLKIQDKVRFLGWQDDIMSFYNALDINTLTSLSETFPYALTEGARLHLPTIASRVGGVPRLIHHGKTGLLFEAGDIGALASHISALASDPILRRRLGDSLFSLASRDYSLQVTKERQLEIYSAILRREARKNKKDGVLICGSYGRDNAGDDAILEAILLEMRSLDPDMPVTVMTRRSRNIAARYRTDTVYTFNFPKFLSVMRRSKLYLNGGGSLIQDVTSRRSLWFYLFTLAAAKRCGCAVQMYGCGFGPVNRRFSKWLSVRVLNSCVDVITLREDDSLREIREMGIIRPELILSSDPALTLPPAPPEIVSDELERSGIDPDGKYICFSVRRWPGFNEKIPVFAAAADYAYKKYGLTPVFVPIEPRYDIGQSKAVMEAVNSPCLLWKGSISSGLTIGVYSRMRVVISMRLHGLIFASSQGVPLIGIAYDKKVSSFLRYIGQDLFADLSEIDTDRLCSFIDRAVERGGRRGELLGAVKRLRDVEKRNTDAAAKLLGL